MIKFIPSQKKECIFDWGDFQSSVRAVYLKAANLFMV